jgi:hypothetical protein
MANMDTFIVHIDWVSNNKSKVAFLEPLLQSLNISCPHTLGLQQIGNSFGTKYKVIDKELFLLSVIQHGIEYKKICDLPPYTKQ